MRNIFIPKVNEIRRNIGKPTQKALFIVDSHSTRKNEEAIRLFEENNICVVILPAHSSTILQPLDLTVNGELKRLLRLRFRPKKDLDTATKRNKLLYKTVECLQGAFLAMHITDGFERAGIYPFSKEAPLNSSLVIHADDRVDFTPPAKKNKTTRIAGKVLTLGDPFLHQIASSSPYSNLQLVPVTLPIVPMQSTPLITSP